jgi:hypothetical protein
MEDWQQRRLRKLVDDYKSNNFTSDQITRAVSDLATLINPPHISDSELDRFIEANVPRASRTR